MAWHIAAVATIWLVATSLLAPDQRSSGESLVVAGSALVAQLALSYRVGARTQWAGTRTYQISQVWLSGFGTVLATLIVGRVVSIDTSVAELIVAASLSTLLIAAVDEYRATRPARQKLRAVLIGTGEETAEWFELLDDHPEVGIELIGCVGDGSSAERVGVADRWLGPIDDLISVLDAHRVDLPILAVTSFRRPAVHRIVDTVLAADHDVAMSWGVGRLSSARLGAAVLSHEALPIIRAPREQGAARRVKRALDVFAAALMLLVGAPVLLLAFVAVWLESRGPALFYQSRVGLNGKPFQMIKFRTMVVAAENQVDELKGQNERAGPLFKLNRDPRVTRVGRVLRASSIDELPQLVNVLRGEMSLVGPRPALVEEFEDFDDELATRTLIRPGLTGLWQVEARSNSSFSAYRRLDLHYLQNWSLGFDLRIMVATAHMLVLGTVVSTFARPGGGDEHRNATNGAAAQGNSIDARSSQASPNGSDDDPDDEPVVVLEAG